ncbi:hypothetical protein HB672_09755 [Gaetbulibacter sp. S0825]|nr:hypothetical protein [Gaetbulibacter sp. S0825]
METGKTGKYFKYAIGEIVLVVIGILIALQINNWNENRKKIVQEVFILEKLQFDIALDLSAISIELTDIDNNINELTFCTDAILGKTEPTREEFIKNLNSLLTISLFDQNQTTFNNIVSSGQIEYIQNQALTDSITKYYNYDYKGWDTALRDYTRNITAPFMLNFDHIPQANLGDRGFDDFIKIDINQSKIKPKTLEDYRNEVFFLNTLRQKIWNMEGQKIQYQNLKKMMFQLSNQIDSELKKSK